jgi:flagellar protein FlgJ
MATPITSAASAPLAPAASTTTTAANTYSDLNGLASLKKDPQSPQTLHAVAQQVDALFLQMMLKSMRDASSEQGDPQSNEMGMYQDMFDKQVALNLSQHGGLGLGASLFRQAAAATAPGAAKTSGALPARPGAVAPPASAPPAVAPAAAASGPGPTASVSPAAGVTGASAGAASTPGEFVNRVLPAIRAAATALGVSPLGLLAQAALETGWGRRMPRTAAGASSLNLFGIKADQGWEGARAGAATLEYSGGVATPKHTAFRAYGTLEQSINDYAKLLGSSPRYRGAVGAGPSPAAYVEHIAKAGYATDPEYADKLHRVLNSHVFRQAVADSAIDT